MQFYVASLLALCGIACYVAIHHLWIARNRPDLHLHRIFAALAGVLVAYLVLQIMTQLVPARQLIPGFDSGLWVGEMLAAGLLMAFVATFTGQDPWRLRRPATVALAAAAILPLVLPYGMRSNPATELMVTVLPWGEQVWHADAQFGLAYYLCIVLVALCFAWCFTAAWRSWRATRSGRQFALLLSLTGIALAVVNDVIADLTGLHTVPVIAHSFVLLAAIMGHVISAEVARTCELESRLRRTEQFAAVGRLAGGVAHDFGNVLTGVLGHAELLMEQPEARSQAAAITAAARRGTALTRQLLAFARGSSSTSGGQAGGDAHEILREVAGLISSASPAVEVQLALAPGAAPVAGDAARLHAALLNLAVNARDAMGGAGQLRLATARRGPPAEAMLRHIALPVPLLEITVSDNGAGIAAEVMPHLFELQFTTKGGNGSGLGLVQVDDMVRDAGGSLAVESLPGQGTTFRLWLPLVGTSLGDMRAPAGARVLLVAGSSSLDHMLTTGLGQLGYQIARLGHADAAHLHAAVIDVDHAGDEGLAQIMSLQDRLPVVVLADHPADWPCGELTIVLPKPAGLSDLGHALRQAAHHGRRRATGDTQPAVGPPKPRA